MSFVNHQEVWFVRYGADLDEDENGPNYKNDLFPKAALMNDRKFLKILEQIKADFDWGCRGYLSSLG